MSQQVNRQWLLKSRPEGMVSDADFEWREAAPPAAPPGGLLVRSLYFSFDPTQRGWLNDAPGYMPPVQIGEPMRAAGIGQVVQSRRDDFKPGDLVQGLLSWQDYVALPADTPWALEKIPPGDNLTDRLGVFGLTGTGYLARNAFHSASAVNLAHTSSRCARWSRPSAVSARTGRSHMEPRSRTSIARTASCRGRAEQGREHEDRTMRMKR